VTRRIDPLPVLLGTLGFVDVAAAVAAIAVGEIFTALVAVNLAGLCAAGVRIFEERNGR
jgi:hypothetical protein